MFTGIIQKKGKFLGLSRINNGSVINIECTNWDNDPYVLGESIAVDGVCLTLVKYTNNSFSADVMNETIDLTTLSKLKYGDIVNLERAMKATDKFGGHIVQGHVDGVGEIVSIVQNERDYVFRIKVSSDLSKYIVYKGSIAINGTSLTVSSVVNQNEFEVSIIPTTLRETSLSEKNVNSLVNIETDIIGRYHLSNKTQEIKDANSSSSLTIEKLLSAGFNV